jgi:hypothetical protein
VPRSQKHTHPGTNGEGTRFQAKQLLGPIVAGGESKVGERSRLEAGEQEEIWISLHTTQAIFRYFPINVYLSAGRFSTDSPC